MRQKLIHYVIVSVVMVLTASCSKSEQYLINITPNYTDQTIIDGNKVIQEHLGYLEGYNATLDNAVYTETQEFHAELSHQTISRKNAEIHHNKSISFYHGRYRLEEFAIYCHLELVDCEPLCFTEAGKTFYHPCHPVENGIPYDLPIKKHSFDYAKCEINENDENIFIVYITVGDVDNKETFTIKIPIE